jgi:hypothetical protein
MSRALRTEQDDVDDPIVEDDPPPDFSAEEFVRIGQRGGQE